jgi:hypothetical protein
MQLRLELPSEDIEAHCQQQLGSECVLAMQLGREMDRDGLKLCVTHKGMAGCGLWQPSPNGRKQFGDNLRGYMQMSAN